MPTYVYRCAKCGEHLEETQSFSDPPLTRHQGCGGRLARVLSAAGIILKGSGFYKNDSRTSSGSRGRSSSSSSSDTGSSSDSGSGSGSSSDASSSSSSSGGSTGDGASSSTPSSPAPA